MKDGLSVRARALTALSAAVAAGDPPAVKEWMERAAEVCGPEAVEEAILQSYLFVGFPTALMALSLWRERERPVVPEADPLATPETVSDWTSRGEDICRTVYGRSYHRLRRNVERLHPALDRWMITEGYGKVLGRPGLALEERELCIVAILAVTGWEAQLHSHLRGALNAGAMREDVEGALEVGLARSADADWSLRARRLWERVGSRRASGD
jgi:4-carboxymuconolactone decarboxylase